jgi:hypothetical protein
MNIPSRYLSYLLRLWQTDDQGQPVWRASLEYPGTRERQGFADLDELFKFLQTQTLSRAEQDHAQDTQGNP